jgi:hypothetical protein
MNSQAHCVVAQASTNPKLAKELASPTHRLTGIKHETLIHNIKQLGFSGLRGFCSRANVFLGGYRRAPKTQPFHIAKR